MKKYTVLLFITALFILIRLPFLDQLFLLHDERDIVISGYSIAKTGKDIFGNALPLSFNNISPNNPLLAICYSAFWSLINPIRSVFYARLPFVLISSLLIFLIYQLIYTITKDKNKSLVTTIIFCFSPWIFHLTRLAMDISLAVVILVTGILLYLKNKRLLSYIFFFMASYTYQGFRLLVPFLVIYLETYFLIIKQRNIKSYLTGNIINIIFVIILLSSTLFIDKTITVNRIKEIVFFNTELTTNEVIFKRTTSIAPEIMKAVFSNKLVSSLDYILTNFIKGQDLIYLFKEGDYSAINGSTASGQFLLMLIVFYYLGFAALGKKAKITDFYILGFIIVGMVPSMLSTHGSSYSIRSILSGIGYAYILSLGILLIVPLVKRNIFAKAITGLFILALFINLLFFSYNYYLRRPVTVSEIYNENERQFTYYLLNNRKEKAVIYSPHPQDIYLSIAFLDNKLPMTEMQKGLTDVNSIKWDGYAIVKCDHTINYMILTNSIIAEGCLSPKQYGYFSDINNPKVKERIKYKDYSTKTAYFVVY